MKQENSLLQIYQACCRNYPLQSERKLVPANDIAEEVNGGDWPTSGQHRSSFFQNEFSTVCYLELQLSI